LHLSISNQNCAGITFTISEILMCTCNFFSKVAYSRYDKPSAMFWTECSKIWKHYEHDHARQTWKGYLLLSLLFPTSLLPATKDKYHINIHRLFKKTQNYYHLLFLYNEY
jgi:hypothetical protein